MNKVIHIKKLEKEVLPYISNKESNNLINKGWSFSNIFDLQLLKDIYLLVVNNNLQKPSEVYHLKHLIEIEKSHSDRKVLEYLNALKNFRIFNENYVPIHRIFNKSELNQPLTINDIEDLNSIFFSFHHFKEITNWFLPIKISPANRENIIKHSQPLYYFNLNSRFTNAFLKSIEKPQTLFYIEDNLSQLMRFWDVFLKWGKELELIDRFNLAKVDYQTDLNKSLSVAYFVNPFIKFDLKEFIKTSPLTGRYIFIPELIFEVVKAFRYSVTEIKRFIVSEVTNNYTFSYERTSEIFIINGANNKEVIKKATYLFPLVNGYYISHLVIRKNHE